jgi:ribosome-binding factor A
MPTRRQEKFARLIRGAVSGAIRDGLSDPRIAGLVSVTKVYVSADLRNAEVFVSVFGADEAGQRRTFAAIEHGRSRIQSLMAEQLETRFCPVLHFRMDEGFKKTMETMKLIDEISRQFKDDESAQSQQN